MLNLKIFSIVIASINILEGVIYCILDMSKLNVTGALALNFDRTVFRNSKASSAKMIPSKEIFRLFLLGDRYTHYESTE